MAQIHVLDAETIDKIAAGEVVERPASVVKELVENAIDAGADTITVEARDGGISFLRVSDNGDGMEKTQVKTAFLRHATSKISSVEDLLKLTSLGFRGEALSSIAAVSKVEMITKTKSSLTGVRYVIEGGSERTFEEVGAPDGTTIIMRNLFYNTPARKKFLKQPATEGGYIAELMEHLALSRPDISFQLILGSQTRFHTSGSGDTKDAIYRIYGKEIFSGLIPMKAEQDGIRVEGYLGKPTLVRSNRNYEIYFINGRFIRSQLIARALEEGYREYLMQHKFPLCVLHIFMEGEGVDVNVHPTKMDVRFADAPAFCNFLSRATRDTLHSREMIPSVGAAPENKSLQAMQKNRSEKAPEPFEKVRGKEYLVREEPGYTAGPRAIPEPSYTGRTESKENPAQEAVNKSPTADNSFLEDIPSENASRPSSAFSSAVPSAKIPGNPEAAEHTQTVGPPLGESPRHEPPAEIPADSPVMTQGKQMDLFEERLLTTENRSRFHIIGQAFETYWIVEFEDRLLIIDQHAAHEKVKYERLMAAYRNREVTSQQLLPPMIVTLNTSEELTLKEHLDSFRALGFEVEAFGGNEYAVRSVPTELYGCDERELFLEVLDALSDGPLRGTLQAVDEKIASMSCKAAVKGNNRLSVQEAEELIDELLTLDNPYNCPHGRPTVISMTKSEMEKHFKRIVS